MGKKNEEYWVETKKNEKGQIIKIITHLSQSLEKQIIDLYNLGESIKKISALVNISKLAIRKILINKNIEIRSNKYYLEGKTYKEISGEKEAIERKNNVSKRFKNIGYEERYGPERAKEIKEKIRIANLKTWAKPEIRNKLLGQNNPQFNKSPKSYAPEKFQRYWNSMKGKKRAQIIGEEKAKEASIRQSESLLYYHKNEESEKRKARGNKISETKLRLIKEGKLNPLKGQNIRPNNPETFINNILKDNCLTMKYTGDGSFWIAGFNPDFVDNVNKKIIELFGDYWHNRPESITRDNIKIQAYEKEGYKTLVIWEHEIQDRHGIPLKDTKEAENKIKVFTK
jgi:G:T-mismatch repair DNA endonuclease (very short patch repair protein)